MTARTVTEVYEMISERHERTADFKAPSTEIKYHADRVVSFPSKTRSQSLFLASESATLNDRALRQLSERFDVPSRWVFDEKACPDPLRALVLNWKFENVESKEMLLRTISEGETETLRAVLSERYQPYDNLHLWEAVMAASAQLPQEPKVVLRETGDELRGYLLFEGIRFDGETPPDRRTQDGGGSGGLHPAVYFGNSEVGGGRVRIASGLYRGYCDNGMIYGWKEEGALAITHLWSQRNHIALAVHEGIANALSLSEDAAQRMLAAMDQRVEPTALGGIFDRWSEKYGLTVASKDAWKAMVRGEATAFDLVNAATVIAHGVKNPEECESVERMAGDLLAYLVPPERR